MLIRFCAIAVLSVFGIIPILTPHKAAPPSTTMLKEIRNNSMLLVAEKGRGSAFIVSRKRGTDVVHFAWTAGHNVTNNQTMYKVLKKEKTADFTYDVYYDQVSLLTDVIQDGRKVGAVQYLGDIIRYSCETRGEDLALIQLCQKNLRFRGVKFYLEEEIPESGIPIWHVGSINGFGGFNSTSAGVIASVGRVRNANKTFDQASITAFNGSSGCGLFLKRSGECVGVVTQRSKDAPNVIFYRPVREMIKWANLTNCKWALDPSIPLPSDEEIRKTRIHELPALVPDTLDK